MLILPFSHFAVFFTSWLGFFLAGGSGLSTCHSLHRSQLLLIQLCMCYLQFFWHCGQFSAELCVGVNSSPVQSGIFLEPFGEHSLGPVLFLSFPCQPYWLVRKFLLPLQTISILSPHPPRRTGVKDSKFPYRETRGCRGLCFSESFLRPGP